MERATDRGVNIPDLPPLKMSQDSAGSRQSQGERETNVQDWTTVRLGRCHYIRDLDDGSGFSAEAPLAAGDPLGYLHQGIAGPVWRVAYRSQDNKVPLRNLAEIG